MSTKAKIIYTKTDEAPALATRSFLPIIRAFTKSSNIEIVLKDISLTGRILANFNDYLPQEQKITNDLDFLTKLVLKPDANIIKLPNISASTPQIKAAIKELQQSGYKIPDYPEKVSDDKEKEILTRYNKVKGSAVNPVLREGNSDRRAPNSVKVFARENPHHMGKWSSSSRTHVATMDQGDFAHTEKSLTINSATEVKIIHFDANNNQTVLKSSTNLLAGEIIDASIMCKNELLSFLEKEFKSAKDNDILLSLHLKATMMKVSDPIIFGHAVKVYFKELFEKYDSIFEEIGVNVNNGFGNLLNKLDKLDIYTKDEILNKIESIYSKNASISMVNSDKGITNLHVPSDVIIDASMPALIRNSGQLWAKNGDTEDTKAVIPDSSYANLYQATIDFCKKNGSFNPKTMGSVPNVGLMANKAEEYGSHDKTFEIKKAGTVKVIDITGSILIEHDVNQGDIWRMCQTKDDAIKDWLGLAIKRARLSKTPIVFWLDKNRAHDSQLIKKVNKYLLEHDINGLEIHIMPISEATLFTLSRVKEGKDTISVTGNVLRDYLTDLFPILELGTSAKMLSIVPLMNGGALFETGAGGSAPKHVEQFNKENHLRWDSLGEFLALTASLEHLGITTNNEKAKTLAFCLDKAIEKLLQKGKSPSRNVKENDNRSSHFYIALYWSEMLSKQDTDTELKIEFNNLHKKLLINKDTIINEFIRVQGKPVQINGYYHTNESLTDKYMRPSDVFNDILEII